MTKPRADDLLEVVKCINAFSIGVYEGTTEDEFTFGEYANAIINFETTRKVEKFAYDAGRQVGGFLHRNRTTRSGARRGRKDKRREKNGD